jgi:hypothetical protein
MREVRGGQGFLRGNSPSEAELGGMVAAQATRGWRSPDRADALVWAMTALAGRGVACRGADVVRKRANCVPRATKANSRCGGKNLHKQTGVSLGHPA